jgi:predicted kinase
MSYYEKPLILMFLGSPGSGKSYFAKHIADKLNAVRINGDSMRLAIFGSLEEIERIYHSNDRRKVNEYVFNGLDYVAEQILQRGQDVVYDAHQNKRIDRETVEQIAERQHALPVVISIKTPYEVAVKRGQTRESQVDQRQLSEEKMREVIARHQANTDEPVKTEHVIVLDGEIAFEEQFKEFEKRLKEIMMYVG